MSDLNKLSLNSTVARNPGVVESEIDGEVVAMDIESGGLYGLDPVGSRIWHLIAEAVPVSDVCAKLLSEYEVETAACERDVLSLLSELYAEKLISIVPSK